MIANASGILISFNPSVHMILSSSGLITTPYLLDFHFQEIMVEILWRLYRKESPKKLIDLGLSEDNTEKFLAMKKKTFFDDVRDFLVKLNSSVDKPRYSA